MLGHERLAEGILLPKGRRRFQNYVVEYNSPSVNSSASSSSEATDSTLPTMLLIIIFQLHIIISRSSFVMLYIAASMIWQT